MTLFALDDSVELIGVGASKRSSDERFEGLVAIRAIVDGDGVSGRFIGRC